jgi:thioredoxin 1
MSKGIAITRDNFESEVVQSPVPVLVDFWADWCGPCRTIAPFIDQLAEEYAGRVKVCKVNVDDENALAEKHGIVSIPTLVVYKNGGVAGQKIGAVPKHDIEALLKEALLEQVV